MPWLARHNPEIDWRTGEVKMTRCPEECGKQWRPVQGKSGWKKQKEEEAGKKREEKETEKKENNRSKESGGRMGDMGQGRRSSEVRNGSKEVGTREVSQVDKGVWKEAVRKNANKKIMRSCNRCEGRVCTMKRKDISTVERGERGGKRICEGAVEEEIHLAIEVTTNSTSILCGEERWEETNGTGLQISE